MIEVPQVVTIAGIDSSGGAGINADTKTFHNQKVYAATIVTGLTAQNTYGVQDIDPSHPEFILSQFDSVFSDLKISAAKTGALFGKAQVEAVIEGLKKYKVNHLTVDPVMIAKGGARLLSNDAIELIKNELFPLAEVITPNIEEAEVMVGYKIENRQALIYALKDLQRMGAKNVLIKGGHTESEVVSDFLLTGDGKISHYDSKRIMTNRTHGTGDTLSSYITAHLAQGETLIEIMPKAKAFILATIKETIHVGHGHGPLNHWVNTDE
ncbi:bifunctional hydroxymethylpyrimidine kinase/phosphomethylpyrimidine kinase [Lactococcus protaetiae]|uniref:Hydroxymethylpyrimidine/phosphomethylpyrimidine kinase n=1 Tax=Lactococcus protaetiae TaxID=2592653 RepID=A0A514Z887_9LACT|nr:bifunctional hydroxymethylpyrimidine kinase/phosphomethylpyrimidine kinase [Lactococcus protaetiae]QDK70798.1 bifunctional hydroxymethylpyrimidine kinase/phosphomethylpyrimidine kinase [Lactococcus protaetiae]